MKYLLTLSQDYRIAEAELTSLFGKVSRTEGIAFVTIGNPKLLERLAYAREAYTYLFTTSKKRLIYKIKTYNWKGIVEKDFCVRTYGGGAFTEREIGGLIYDRLTRPRVNLRNPETAIGIFVIGNMYHFGILERMIYNDFRMRRAHLRPVLHPSSLSPKLARAMVNLSGIRRGTLVDPFCGTGGILIEAGLMDLRAKGYDIDESMVNGCKKNLSHYGIGVDNIKLADSTKTKERWDYVVTDLPYGKNTRKDSRLFEDFLDTLETNLGKRAVVGFPKGANAKKMILNHRFKIEHVLTCRLHKSLSKEIFVMENSCRNFAFRKPHIIRSYNESH